MKRRDFVKTSMATAALAGVGAQAGAQGNKAAQEWYELRVYNLKADNDGKALHDFLRDAAIPAWNRLGSRPVGVFTPRDAPKTDEAPSLFVLVPHASLEAFAAAPAKLLADETYRTAGAAYLNLPSTDAAYVRYESSLLRAFASMPKIELPAYSREQKPRLFELRTYESHSETAGAKKIEMFDTGETDLMRRVGLGPVFFGEMVIGSRLPNLTYLLSAESDEAHKAHWDAFRTDPEWKRMSAIPEYANARIVSKITNKFLVPTAYSQI
jgi:hypothetical protein